MYTLNTIDRPAVYDARGNGDGETVPTLTGDHQNRITDYTAICIGNGQLNQMSMQDVSNTLDTMHDQQAVMERERPIRRLTPLEGERLQGLPDRWGDIGDWVDSKGKTRKTTDSLRYEMIGNGIALPFWNWLLKRINEHCTEHTMGSLFNGSGSFPLIWERLNGEKSCRWVSEIAEYPIAVTKRHFGDEETGERGDLYVGSGESKSKDA